MVKLEKQLKKLLTTAKSMSATVDENYFVNGTVHVHVHFHMYTLKRDVVRGFEG